MWSTYLFHTRSGNLGPRVKFSSASWDMTINGTENFNGALVKSSIPILDSSFWLEPWWAGIALLWNNIPVFAGPITARPSEDFNSLNISCKGPRSLFTSRTPVKDMADWSKLLDKIQVQNWSTDGPYTGTDMSSSSPYLHRTYASMARIAVEDSLTKLGGDLPINFKMPLVNFYDAAPLPPLRDPQDRAHYKRIAGWEGRTVDSFLTELSETENGPDIMFRPILNGSRIEWDMWTGKDDSSPEIPQESDTVWDTTSAAGYITNLEVQYSGAYMTNRVFVTGAGSGGAQHIRMHQNRDKIAQGFPLLERFEASPHNNAGAVDKRAKALLDADTKARHQLNATVRTDGINQVGTFWPGEYGKLITSGWYGLKNGETRAKILTMSGDLSNNMQIGFKETEVE